MSKLKLLIFDANVVIFMNQRRIWSKVIARCDVSLPATVVDEASFFVDDSGARHDIDLSHDISQGHLRVFEVSLGDLQKFQQRFDLRYISQLDPGELEALTYLCNSSDTYLICSADAIVYRVLGSLGKGEQGISVEEILASIGLQQANFEWAFTKRFRKKYTDDGFTDRMQNRGLRA